MKIFRKTPLNSRGFSHVEAFIAILVIAGIAAVGARVIMGSHADTPPLSIVYTNNNSIYTAQDNGQNANSVYTPPPSTTIENVAWGQNGSTIFAYNSNGKILSMTNGGQSPKVIATTLKGGGVPTSMSWSETNQLLAYTKGNGTAIEPDAIYTVKPNGNKNKLFFELWKGDRKLNEQILSIQWSPNGKYMLVLCSQGSGQDLYVINSSNQQIAAEDSTSPISVGSNAWTADSNNIIYSIGNTLTEENITTDAHTTLYSIGDPTSSDYTNPTVYSATLSPDGSKIAFVTNPDPSNSSSTETISDISSTGSGSPQTLVLSSPKGGITVGPNLDWSPDSTQIAYNQVSLQGNSLYVQSTTSSPSSTNVPTLLSQNNSDLYFTWSNQ